MISRLFKALFLFFKHNEISRKLHIRINLKQVVLRVKINDESFEQVFRVSDASFVLFKHNELF